MIIFLVSPYFSYLIQKLIYNKPPPYIYSLIQHLIKPKHEFHSLLIEVKSFLFMFVFGYLSFIQEI